MTRVELGDGTGAMSPTREAIAHARRVVVKIGSSVLTSVDGGLNRESIGIAADLLERRMRRGSDVFVVSSGAIAAGLAPLGLRRRPSDIATKQAAAATGQLELSKAWGDAFSTYGRTVAQVLLTASDIGRRESARNAQRTLDRLRVLHAVPVINENDTVATSEIHFGDNDRLAALVAHITGADALILLSDVDGLYDADPRSGRANFISEVAVDENLDEIEAGNGGPLGTGGMASKLISARLAADCGIPVLLGAFADAEKALSTADVGTVFASRSERMSAKKFWVRHAADVRGRLYLDDGAARAVQQRRSLLAAGIVSGEGDFHEGDVVELINPSGNRVARGIIAYDSGEMAFMYRLHTTELPLSMQHPVIHADCLSLTIS